MIIGLAALIAVQGTPFPASDTLAFDIQCMSASNLVNQRQESPNAGLLAISAFYLGRIEGRGVSDTEILGAGELADLSLDEPAMQALLRQCQVQLTEATRRLVRVGQEAAARDAENEASETPAGR